MVEPRINMLSQEEIAELAEIRKKMEELQARYDALVARAHPLGRPGLAPLVEVQVSDSTASAAVPSTAPTPPAPAPSPAATAPSTPVPTPASSTKPLAGLKLSEAVVAVLREAGHPLSFEAIFKRLQEDGALLPAEKPMLAVRQVLYNQKLFTVERGRFRLANP